jgi:homoserine dehydrogenase
MLDAADALASGAGVHNVVEVRTALAGTLTWHGAGAGGRSTASALLADTIAATRTLVTTPHTTHFTAPVR